MKRIIIFIVFTISVCSANIKTDIAKCADKSTDAMRLMCYDNLAKKLDVDKPKSKVSADKGKWIISEETSAIDDSKNVTLMLDAENDIKGSLNSLTPKLILRCSEKQTHVYVNWGVYLGIKSTSVLIRLDKDKAQTRKWAISTDNKSTFAVDKYFDNDGVYFINELLQHNKLLMQITPFRANPVMTTFELEGLKESIKPLKRACKKDFMYN